MRSMDSSRITELTPPVLELAQRAGAAILDVYRQPVEVVTKADTSPLTIADLRSHEAIVEGLAALTPDVPVLSEESRAVPFSTRRTWGTFWLVDPLDGTKEFLARNDQFTVNIALINGHSPAFGVVYVPAQDLIYWGGAGLGAFRRHANEAAVAIRVCDRAPETLRVVGSRSHASDALTQVLPRLGPFDLVQIGSSLKFCLIAAGEADVYPRFGPTSEWDTAAAQALVEGAGGAVVTREGRPLRYNEQESLLNPHFVAFGDASRDWVGALFA
jgi:3'(2'), 5'-bisphosphate nucleotidase